MIPKITNSPNFKAVYYNRQSLTKNQMNIAYNIVHKFRAIDFSDQKSRTFEENLRVKLDGSDSMKQIGKSKSVFCEIY